MLKFLVVAFFSLAVDHAAIEKEFALVMQEMMGYELVHFKVLSEEELNGNTVLEAESHFEFVDESGRYLDRCTSTLTWDGVELVGFDTKCPDPAEPIESLNEEI